jgi:hypothetical protein
MAAAYIANVGVVGRRIGEIGVLRPLVGDGRKKHDARMAFAGIIFGQRCFQKRIQVGLELFQAGFSLEGLVETEEGKDHIRLHFGQPVVGRAEIRRPMAQRHFVGGNSQVAKNQIEVRIPGVKISLHAQEWNEGSRAEPRRARRKQEPTERQAQPNFHHEAHEEHEEEPLRGQTQSNRIKPNQTCGGRTRMKYEGRSFMRHGRTQSNPIKPDQAESNQIKPARGKCLWHTELHESGMGQNKAKG